MLESQSALQDPSSIQDGLPWDASKQIPEQAKICSSEIQDCDPVICLVSSSQEETSLFLSILFFVCLSVCLFVCLFVFVCF